MKTVWDYTSLADAYLNRPAYADAAIDRLLAVASVSKGQPICDIGAGAAHLTMMLAQRDLTVTAVEPNNAMRAHGIARTASFPSVNWHEGVAEATGQSAEAFRLVTFGSSFNVTDRPRALAEASRILMIDGWFACMWNHRDLDDPIQSTIEDIIRKHVPHYQYGTRRENQEKIITESRLFGDVKEFEAPVRHMQTIEDCIDAWRSHGTLQRQANAKFDLVVSDIGDYLTSLRRPSIEIPYTTRVWAAQKLRRP